MLFKSIAFGVVGWYSAAQFVKYTGIAEPSTKWSSHSMFALSMPVGMSAVLAGKLLSVPPKDVFCFVSIGTAVALILDGLATVYTPFLYTFQKRTPVEALSAIAFGAGWGILAAYYVTKTGKYPF
jgi:hypothetical protein